MTEGGQIDRRRLVYRWDLDKTYLRTEFDTLRDIFRTAFESARRKQTVPGAAALLRELRAAEPAGVYILSGSPEQMRRVLEAKLRLDGIRWDAFTLKPSLKQLVRGRFRFLRDQVGYKLGALLAWREHAEPTFDEMLFGDDAEADAFIYSLYADICAGRVDTEQLLAILRRARLYEDDLPRIVRLASRVPQRDAVRRIFIHLDRMSPPEVFEEFGRRICPFYNYFQPALVLLEEGAIDAEAALRVGVEILVQHAFPPDALLASFKDLARRGHIGRGAATRILEIADSIDRVKFATAAPVIRAFVEELEERYDSFEVPEPIEALPIDYLGLFLRDKERAHSARRRAMWRRGGTR